MKKLLTRGLVGIAALAVPVGAAVALPMAADAATPPATHIDDCVNATGAATQYPQYPNGCSFRFFDGNGQWTTFSNYQYKDVVSASGNETEVFIGTAADPVANSTGSVVTYDSTNNPNFSGQTAVSFVSGKTTTNWSMTIQPDGEWNLTANFHK